MEAAEQTTTEEPSFRARASLIKVLEGVREEEEEEEEEEEQVERGEQDAEEELLHFPSPSGTYVRSLLDRRPVSSRARAHDDLLELFFLFDADKDARISANDICLTFLKLHVSSLEIERVN